MSEFVTAYVGALHSFDLHTWALFTAVQDNAVRSADRLLLGVEEKALQPAVGVTSSSTTPAAEAERGSPAPSPSLASHQLPCTSASQCPRKPSSEVCFLRQVDPDALHARPSAEKSAVTFCQLLQQELMALGPSGEDVHDRTSCVSTPVFRHLSSFSQALLAFTALWLCTKFWGTVSESSTLSGLVACFLRETQHTQQPHSDTPTPPQGHHANCEHPARKANCRGDEADAPAQAAPPATSDKACGTPPWPEPAAGVVEGLAFTPPQSPVEAPHHFFNGMRIHDDNPTSSVVLTAAAVAVAASEPEGTAPLKTVRLEEEWKAATDTLHLESAASAGGGTLHDSDGRVFAAVHVGEDGALDGPLLPYPQMWCDDTADPLDAVVRDVEDAEMVLLRCSDYSIPV
ncbi:hypothetical protein ABB37_07413 [Leptomonas pyrrhocoris]|uniref:Uncharacterized protein n=1 Tax=Leptomonas pyrrhocoris TaxID=157538 RepID=A0A0M9FVS0_LEPPY|nr:hypothetical protein ABB37_07413 [Leptomonas pyrrhocoris]KPA77090.1 hypothetical protein ABB37_07413 [Leptomonas pyrrhocoris]|eukprot:XP_015655529.1 hypothetical protein ABB37_07413 [Leptomonas pyrrhocoris]